jgi:hypothetical protein
MSEEIVCKSTVCYPPRLNFDVIVINVSPEPEDEFEGLFAVIRHRSAFWAILPEMDDPEPDFGIHLAFSRPAHLGSQILPSSNRRAFGDMYRISTV